MDIWQKHSLALAACQEAKRAKKKNTLHINDGLKNEANLEVPQTYILINGQKVANPLPAKNA